MLDITGGIAIGNGEPCPYCKPKKDKVFISSQDNNYLEHLVKNHKDEFDKIFSSGKILNG